MALSLRWTRIALADLDRAFEFISADRPDAARATVNKILGCLDMLKDFPDSGRVGRIKGTRELVVSTTPYVIVYRMRDKNLEILAVLHSARKWP